MNVRRKVAALLAAISCVWAAQSGWGQLSSSEPLPRRGQFGVALGTNDTGDVLVTAVQPGTTAADTGIEPGDVVRTVDGIEMRAPEDVVAAIGAHRGGERIELQIARAGAVRRFVATLKPFPSERIAGAEVVYGSVALNRRTRLRTIMTVPTGLAGPAPAVLVLQGGGCGSIDQPIGPPLGVVATTHAIASNGFVTLRVEKSGVGESEGPPCAEIGYRAELDGYRAALRALRARAAVDRERVFIVGISLGGVFAPVLANEMPVAGISVFGTLAIAPSPYPGRSERFFEEIGALDVLAEWARIAVPVQVLRAEYDEVTTREWAEMIAAAVNATHPGGAELSELDGLDHCATRHATREESVGRCGAGQAVPDLHDAVLTFLKAHG